MEKDVLTLIVSIATFSVAYSQMKIASAKTKLDLYNKRFNIYQNTLDYYQATWKGTYEEMQKKALDFTKAYRESQFLFDKHSQIHEILGRIQQNGSTICFYEETKQENERNSTNDNATLAELHKSSNNARDEFHKNLLILEEKMMPYIKFHKISGWNIF